MGVPYCCALFLGVCLLVGIIEEIYLSLKTYTPSFSIKDVYIPALDTRLPNFNSSNAAATFVFFDLQINRDDDVSYELFNPALVFYYGRFCIANYSSPRFSDTALMRDVVETQGMPWSDACAAVSGGLTAAFGVEFSGRMKVNRELWRTEYKEVLVRGDFEVNGYGEKVQKKDIKLKPFVKSVSNTLASVHQSDTLISISSA